MIYAIRALGTEFVKIGYAKSVGKRLKELDTGCPHGLHIEAVADWPKEQERAIHLYLVDSREKLEWFRDSERTKAVISMLRDEQRGLMVFRAAFLQFTKYDLGRAPLSVVRAYEYPSQKKTWQITPPPILTIHIDGNEAERFERIKQTAIARKARRQACAA